ncbi:hypothetical protein V1521DRAFT_458878 [Lipomyces starkeyi]
MNYSMHLRHAHERRDFGCPRSIEHKTERDPSSIHLYTGMACLMSCLTEKKYFECYVELHISFSKANESATIIYEHIGHTESHKFHMTQETEELTITRQQVYNFWHSLTQSESAQQLLAEQEGYELIQGLQEPGIPLAFHRQKFNRAKMTEVFIDSTFGTNKHGFELYYVLTEYDLVSLPLSYLLLGKRGSRLTEWFTALRNAGLIFLARV